MEAGEQDQEQEVVKGFKSHIPLIIGIIAVVLLGWFWHKEYARYINTDDAYVDSDKVGIAPKILGRISKLYYEETDSVKKGSLLAELDSTELKAQQSQIAVMIQQNLVSVKQSEAEYNLSKENVKLQNINLLKTTTDLARAKTQFEGGVITLENYEHIQKDFEAAQAKFTAAEKQAAYAKSQIPVNMAELEKTKAQYNFVKTQLNNTRLYAPINGVLAKRWLLPGDVAIPGQSIYTLVNDKTFWVSVYLEETKLSDTRIGSKAIITLDAFPEFTFKGKVFYISSNTASQFSLDPPNNASGNFTKISQRYHLKISIDTALDKKNKNVKPVKLLPGMSAVVKIIK